MIDAFNDLWQAMTPEQREGIAWIAARRNADGFERSIGEGSREGMLDVACCALDALAKQNSNNYDEYRKEAMAALEGIATGLLDGAMKYYLRKR